MKHFDTLRHLLRKNTIPGVFLRAGGLGLEPRYSGPKPDVLPLDDPPMTL